MHYQVDLCINTQIKEQTTPEWERKARRLGVRGHTEVEAGFFGSVPWWLFHACVCHTVPNCPRKMPAGMTGHTGRQLWGVPQSATGMSLQPEVPYLTCMLSETPQ